MARLGLRATSGTPATRRTISQGQNSPGVGLPLDRYEPAGHVSYVPLSAASYTSDATYWRRRAGAPAADAPSERAPGAPPTTSARMLFASSKVPCATVPRSKTTTAGNAHPEKTATPPLRRRAHDLGTKEKTLEPSVAVRDSMRSKAASVRCSEMPLKDTRASEADTRRGLPLKTATRLPLAATRVSLNS